jgi:hypothetical protein
VDAKGSRFIRTGADDAPLIWRGADDYGLAAQFRPVALFNRREKGIHVDMENATGHGENYRFAFDFRRMVSASLQRALLRNCLIALFDP